MRTRFLTVAVAAAIVLGASAAHGAVTLAIFTVAGNESGAFKGDGKAATAASLNGPAGLVAAPDGGFIVADTINQRIRRVDPSGQRIFTLAGNGDNGFKGDGGLPTEATFQDPSALALGVDDTLYVADTANNRIRAIRANGTVTTVAGNGAGDPTGDGGPATASGVNAPAGVAVDSKGRLFYSDSGNHRVRMIDQGGIVTTVAGTGTAGAGGDGGPARNAQLKSPAGLAFAADGSLLIADSGNNKIRRVAPDTTISTVAGTGGGGSGGDGGPATSAQLNVPVDIAAGPQGGFFIAEQGGNRIRHVDTQGNIARLAGTGGPRFGGDGHPAAGALLNAPRAIELMPSGNELLIADTDNNRIRYIAIPGQSSLLAVAPLKLSVTAPLVKVKRTVKGKKRRTLVVTNVPLSFRVSKETDLVLRIRTKKGGRLVKTLSTHAGAGAGAVHLPRSLRSGKRRLKKDHYVVGVTAKAGTAIAVSSMELVVK